MKIFDSLTQKKTTLPKPTKGTLKLFVCGPTVYDYSHIGHARVYSTFDSLAKYLRSQKIKVFYLQNITDADDKIIIRAKETRTNPLKLALRFEKEYLKDIKALNITSVDKYARATDHIKEIQNQISTLIKKGYAYQTKNGIYFEVRKSKKYGQLSKQILDELRPGYRIEPDPEKKDPLDFALWKKVEINSKNKGISLIENCKLKIENSEPLWSSPWGWGRPGWHIEDTAISEKYFGPQYDIHGGGNDLKFPHHESEIAQQEAASGKVPFVKIWMHSGLILVNGEKMSKSLNNFVTIREFFKSHSPETLRMLVASHHYRSPIDHTENNLQQALKNFQTISEFIWKLEFVSQNGQIKTTIHGQIIKKTLDKLDADFKSSLDNDFNTPKALAAIFEFIGQIQPQIYSLTKKQAKEICKNATAKIAIFGLVIKPLSISQKITKMAMTRDLYRQNKQFMQADDLRKRLEMLGYIIEDTPLGPFIKTHSPTRNL